MGICRLNLQLWISHDRIIDKENDMRVKITGCRNGTFWYNDMINCVFNVVDGEVRNWYEVKHIGFEDKTYYIEKCDCEIVPEKYTYAEVDLPEWWDGRPIKGICGTENDMGYCIGYDSTHSCPYIVEDCEGNGINNWHFFEPLTESKTTAKVTITKDGKTSEIELTAEQVEGLGL